MTCRVYTLGVHQDARRYEADVILSDRVVRGVSGRSSAIEQIFDTTMALYRRVRKLPAPGYREPHTIKQYLVNQFNSAVLSSQEYQDFERLVAERKAEAARSRNLKSVTIPRGFRPIELRQFHEMSIAQGRRATFRERAQFMVLGLMNISEALTPQSKSFDNTEKE